MTNPSRNIDTVLESFEERWSPRILTQVNDWDVRLAKLEGAFVWHAHPDTDELFVVLDGTLDIHLREPGGVETVVHLERHDVFVVPRGTEHCPKSPDGAEVMLFEPTGTLSTGDYAGGIPDHITSTTGISAGDTRHRAGEEARVVEHDVVGGGRDGQDPDAGRLQGRTAW